MIASTLCFGQSYDAARHWGVVRVVLCCTVVSIVQCKRGTVVSIVQCKRGTVVSIVAANIGEERDDNAGHVLSP